jgi:hypothetical protein
MLKIQEYISIFWNHKPYEGAVLGADGDLFWLYVIDLEMVFRGHLCNVFELQGKQYLKAEEWSHNFEDMFDECGQFISDAFWYSKNPEPMIQTLQMYRLLSPPSR